MTLEEEASLSGDCGITNETSGSITSSTALNNARLTYKGNTKSYLTLSETSNISGQATIENDNPTNIKISGTLLDNSNLKYTGGGTGSLIISENTTIEGNSEIYNESNRGIEFHNAVIPNNFKVENKSKNGYISFFANAILHPDTTFTIENLDNSKASVSTWTNFEITKDAKITFSGSGSGGIEPCYKFGGHLNLHSEGNHTVVLVASRENFNGETIKYNIHDLDKQIITKYLYIYTNNWGPNLEVDSIKHIELTSSSSVADNTKIHITGDNDYGQVYLYGSYSGTIEMEFNGTPGSLLYIYNNLGTGNKIILNAPNKGKLYIQPKVNIQGTMTVNNDSQYIVVLDGTTTHTTTIGDGAIINVSKNRTSNLYMREDIPAGAVVNY